MVNKDFITFSFRSQLQQAAKHDKMLLKSYDDKD